MQTLTGGKTKLLITVKLAVRTAETSSKETLHWTGRILSEAAEPVKTQFWSSFAYQAPCKEVPNASFRNSCGPGSLFVAAEEVGQRVYRVVVDSYFVVQVRSGRSTRRTNATDERAAHNFLSHCDVQF